MCVAIYCVARFYITFEFSLLIDIFIMKLNRLEVAGIIASLLLAVLAGVFAFSQMAYADQDPCSLPGMDVIPGMDCGGGSVDIPVDPCDITPCDEPSLGEEITCEVYEELIAQGQPIPSDFDASACNDQGGGGDEAACEDGIDNDNDGEIDMEDPGCSDGTDDDETDSGGGGEENKAACEDGLDNDGDSKVDLADPGCAEATDTDESDPVSGGGGGGGGGGSSGNVLGTTTPVTVDGGGGSCGMRITSFIKSGQKNDVEQVKRMQSILRNFETADVDENGEYDTRTLAAVRVFQQKYASEVLTPWGIQAPTGYVFLTTRKKLNEIYCANMQFPLTKEEADHIAASRSGAVHKPVSTAEPALETKITETRPATTSNSKEVVSTPRNRVSDFIRRLFDRFR